MPKTWNIQKKTHKWAVKASPGPHSGLKSIPLLLVLRDVMKLANSSREAKKILHDGNILVDGVVRRDYKFPVGVFDVITIPKIDLSYRVFLDEKQRLSLRKISDPEVKLCKITDKTIVKGGNTQLNLHDGSNIISDEYSYHSSDSVILSLPERKVVKHITYKPGSLALVIGGAHSGELATIEDVRKTRSTMPNMTSLHSSYDFETIEDYVFVIGKGTPEIETPGGDVVD
uniref:Small ribosomal subunit protein eS4 n=1 Tax=Candidatus Methanogaster sp. ANME-2c ERB4 TaxID=2759911 RepID=A0A7G9YFR5_9EURY|nr:30S ribosomal protein S4e [Methanosarcinales archaeon ANME-2c ERB4]QNO46849.1 30S ribosomal protein S4e [Methanosarcinales archaeon ANME-2c ERB4]